jgi:hypothetical protein
LLLSFQNIWTFPEFLRLLHIFIFIFTFFFILITNLTNNIHKILPLGPMLSQLVAVITFTAYFCMIHFNIILSSTTEVYNMTCFLGVSGPTFCIAYISHLLIRPFLTILDLINLTLSAEKANCEVVYCVIFFIFQLRSLSVISKCSVITWNPVHIYLCKMFPCASHSLEILFPLVSW